MWEWWERWSEVMQDPVSRAYPSASYLDNCPRDRAGAMGHPCLTHVLTFHRGVATPQDHNRQFSTCGQVPFRLFMVTDTSGKLSLLFMCPTFLSCDFKCKKKKKKL